MVKDVLIVMAKMNMGQIVNSTKGRWVKVLEKLKTLFGSRKFYAGLIGCVLVYLNSQLKWFDDVQIASISGLIASWIVGQAVSEGK